MTLTTASADHTGRKIRKMALGKTMRSLPVNSKNSLTRTKTLMTMKMRNKKESVERRGKTEGRETPMHLLLEFQTTQRMISRILNYRLMSLAENSSGE